MAIELRGKPVADAINERVLAKAEALKAEGVNPTLAIVRLGENPDDLSYEKGAIKRCEGVGIAVKTFAFDREISHTEFCFSVPCRRRLLKRRLRAHSLLKRISTVF